MTPATGWHPDDYYRASRAARKAWQSTNQQLAIGLEDGAVGREAPSAPSSSPVPPLGLAAIEAAATPRAGLATNDHGPDSQSPDQDCRGQEGTIIVSTTELFTVSITLAFIVGVLVTVAVYEPTNRMLYRAMVDYRIQAINAKTEADVDAPQAAPRTFARRRPRPACGGRTDHVLVRLAERLMARTGSG